jgi:predicted metal-dependent hydrolase
MLDWPPPHTIRRSKKAKQISLNISEKKGLEIVVPHRATIKEAMWFLNHKREWIEKHFLLIEKSSKPKIISFPSELRFPCLDLIIPIIYERTFDRSPIRFQFKNNCLHLTGDTSNYESSMRALKRFMQGFAEKELSPRLVKLSRQCELPFEQLNWRFQKSIWGSCSSQGNISLNAKMLLLNAEQVRYIMVHELCHTVHMNHSLKFWKLVKCFEKNYQALDKEINQAPKKLPSWVKG